MYTCPMIMKIKSKLICMVLIPMLVCSIVIGFISVYISEGYLNEEQKNILQAALVNFNGDVNSCKQLSIDITVFEGDTRIESSISGAKGTKASQKVIDKVIRGKDEYFDVDVDVNGETYFGYYIPTKDGMLFAGKPRELIINNMYRITGYIILISTVFIILFGLVGLLIARYMANQITNASDNIKKVADGKLNEINKVESNTKDEIYDMSKSVETMADRLSNIISVSSDTSEKVRNSSEELSNTSETTLCAMNEVSKAVEEITIGLQDQSEAVRCMSDSIVDVNGDVESIRSFANDIEKCSNKMEDSSNTVKQKMDEMLDSNERVNENISDIANKIKSITDVVNNVKNIVSVIGDISSQTKLLSLNASIEASHANEYGKGFAVVAKSISDLSENTSKQVVEITNIITDLVKDFDICTDTINKTVANSEIQKEDIYKVMGEFESLSEVINETSNKVQLIGKSVDKTVLEMGSISNEVKELSNIAENSAASTEEVNASVEEINSLMNNVANTAENLKERTDELNEGFKFFKL